MLQVGLQTSIWGNRLKTIYLISLMPILVFCGIFAGYFLSFGKIDEIILKEIYMFSLFSVPVIFLWLFISIFFYKQIIFKFSGAKEITRKENPEIYNIVENLCISRGLPIPKIGILEDNSMNAFATGWNPKNSWVVFSRGLLEKLNKDEIEAVAGHELTHIINSDIKIMLLTNVFIGIIGNIGYFLVRSNFIRGNSKSNNNNNKNPIFFVGLVLYLLSIIILPLVNLAISRKREYLADAGSVELTKNSQSMMTALQKISNNSYIKSIKQNSIARMCIENPLKPKKNIFGTFNKLFSTHPSIEDRIKALSNY